MRVNCQSTVAWLLNWSRATNERLLSGPFLVSRTGNAGWTGKVQESTCFNLQFTYELPVVIRIWPLLSVFGVKCKLNIALRKKASMMQFLIMADLVQSKFLERFTVYFIVNYNIIEVCDRWVTH